MFVQGPVEFAFSRLGSVVTLRAFHIALRFGSNRQNLAYDFLKTCQHKRGANQAVTRPSLTEIKDHPVWFTIVAGLASRGGRLVSSACGTDGRVEPSLCGCRGRACTGRGRKPGRLGLAPVRQAHASTVGSGRPPWQGRGRARSRGERQARLCGSVCGERGRSHVPCCCHGGCLCGAVPDACVEHTC